MTRQVTPANRVREFLTGSVPAVGVSVNIHHPMVVELVGLSGFDFVFFDFEHSALSLERLEDLLRVASSYELGTVVRSPSPGSELTPRILDCGADCVLVPRVETRRDVDDLIGVTRFPPLGQRGMAEASRTTRYGASGFSGEISVANPAEAQVIGVMVETLKAVSDIDAIVQTKGLDFIFVGPEDLAASMGFRGQRNHPKVREAVEHVIEVAHGADVPFAMGVGHPAVALTNAELIDRGVRLILAGRDSNVLLSELIRLRSGETKEGSF